MLHYAHHVRNGMQSYCQLHFPQSFLFLLLLLLHVCVTMCNHVFYSICLSTYIVAWIQLQNNKRISQKRENIKGRRAKSERYVDMIVEKLTLDCCAENVLPNGSDIGALNASLALFNAKGSWSPNPFKVLVPVASVFISFASPALLVVSCLFFLHIQKCHYNSVMRKICFK